jgi:hypothetical protein
VKDLSDFYGLRNILSDEWLDEYLIFKHDHILNVLDEIEFLNDILEYIYNRLDIILDDQKF